MLPSHFKKQVKHAQVTDSTATLSLCFILNLFNPLSVTMQHAR